MSGATALLAPNPFIRSTNPLTVYPFRFDASIPNRTSSRVSSVAHPRISSRPVSRVNASRYFSAVPSTTSGDSSGAGGALFHAMSSR